MFKKADYSFAVSAQSYGNDLSNIQFNTQDKNTAKLIFTIKEKKVPLNLTDVDGEITLVMQDKSRFIDKANVTNPLEGVVEYTITPEQIRHAGIVQGELVLKAKDGSSLSGFRFNFNIKKSLIDENLGPVKEYYIEDLEAVKKEVHEKALLVNVELDALNAEIDTRISDVEDRVNSFESGVAQATVVQVNAAKTNSKNKTYTDLKARLDYIEDGDIDCGVF